MLQCTTQVNPSLPFRTEALVSQATESISSQPTSVGAIFGICLQQTIPSSGQPASRASQTQGNKDDLQPQFRAALKGHPALELLQDWLRPLLLLHHGSLPISASYNPSKVLKTLPSKVVASKSQSPLSRKLDLRCKGRA